MITELLDLSDLKECAKQSKNLFSENFCVYANFAIIFLLKY